MSFLRLRLCKPKFRLQNHRIIPRVLSQPASPSWVYSLPPPTARHQQHLLLRSGAPLDALDLGRFRQGVGPCRMGRASYHLLLAFGLLGFCFGGFSRPSGNSLRIFQRGQRLRPNPCDSRDSPPFLTNVGTSHFWNIISHCLPEAEMGCTVKCLLPSGHDAAAQTWPELRTQLVVAHLNSCFSLQ